MNKKITLVGKLILSVLLITTISCSSDDDEIREEIVEELSGENSIISFEIAAGVLKVNADINEAGNSINQRLLPDTDLTSLDTKVVISENASISPNPETINDYTKPVTFTVTAENGNTKEYIVTFGIMDENYAAQCDVNDASKWFGGDDRESPDNPLIEPRNVGTGQTIRLVKDLYPTSFGVYFRGGFRFSSIGRLYKEDVELKLNIRNADGSILASTTTLVEGSFEGGWVDFDLSSLNLLLKNNTDYYFTWYLIDGESLAVTTGSTGNTEQIIDGIHNGPGYSGQSRKKDGTSLEDWDTWFEHSWYFNFRIEGKQ